MAKDIELAIVFADVVGSTRLYEELGDQRAREVVAICIEIMRQATEEHHGTVIKTMGDEVMSTFAVANDALNAAAKMQKSITGNPELTAEGPPRRDPHRLPLRPGGGRESGRFRLDRSHGESHDQPGQGGPDHHHRGHGGAAVAGLAVRVRQIDVATLKGQGAEVTLFEVLWQTEDITSMLPSVSISAHEGRRAMRLRLTFDGGEVMLTEQRPNVASGARTTTTS
jgi:hypothetical protein